MSKTFADYYKINTLVDVIRVPKVRTSGESLPIDTNFVCILLLVSEFFRGLFSPHSKAKANYQRSNPRKIGNYWYKRCSDRFSTLRENLGEEVDYDNYYYYE